LIPRRRSVFLRVTVLLLLVLVLLAATHMLWFRWLANYLVRVDPLEKSDAILVLAGDWNGIRVLKGAELAKSGYAPLLLISGPTLLYGRNEADLAIDYAVSQGYPREMFTPIISGALSTLEESQFFDRELRKRGVRRLTIVTTDFHTHRAFRIFRRNVGSDIEIRMTAAPDKFFRADSWWTHREGRKTLFFEWSKTIASWIGL
jgi:uncharacterized SAM-binding protein YcdF (DUF218 family)